MNVNSCVREDVSVVCRFMLPCTITEGILRALAVRLDASALALCTLPLICIENTMPNRTKKHQTPRTQSPFIDNHNTF